MCGRFALYPSFAAIKKLIRIDSVADAMSVSCNIAPTQDVCGGTMRGPWGC